MGVVYLVDSENVGIMWKNIIDKNEDQKLFIFYTINTPYISYEDLKFLLDSGSDFRLIECFTGQNALDFQLSSFLGYLISKEESKNDDFIIVSNDKGYDPLCEFWSCRGYSVQRLSLNKDGIKESDDDYEVDFNDMNFIRGILPDRYKKDVGLIRKILEYKKPNQIHNELIKLYGNKDGLALYKLIKPYLSIL